MEISTPGQEPGEWVFEPLDDPEQPAPVEPATPVQEPEPAPA